MKRIWLALFAATCLLSCKKDLSPVKLPAIDSVSLNSDLPSSSNAVSITVNVNQAQTGGYKIPAIFEGLSYETNILVREPDFLNENNKVLIQLIKNLGPGILRIGGNQSDLTGWAGESLNSKKEIDSPDSLTYADIDRLTAFAKAVNWPVLFGLNLGHYNVKAAASEALYVNNSLQKNLYAFQSGNEPDVFYNKPRPSLYKYPDYQKEWDTYFSAVKSVAPAARFAGPDVIPFDNSWINAFADAEHGNVRLITGHYYNNGPASNAAITYQNILTQNPRLEGYLSDMGKISAKYHMPYRIAECNSIYGGGKPGASDVFASALWALDFMWTVAENNGQGVNFHGGGPRFAYSPITTENGVFVARPEYYAMLAFRHGNKAGTIIPATIADPRDYNNCRAYACVNADSSYSVTLINKEAAKNFSFTVQLTKSASTIEIARLKAPAITSATGTTFAGTAISADGTFNPVAAKKYAVNKKSFVINVPAASAAVVTVR